MCFRASCQACEGLFLVSFVLRFRPLVSSLATVTAPAPSLHATTYVPALAQALAVPRATGPAYAAAGLWALQGTHGPGAELSFMADNHRGRVMNMKSTSSGFMLQDNSIAKNGRNAYHSAQRSSVTALKAPRSFPKSPIACSTLLGICFTKRFHLKSTVNVQMCGPSIF